MRDSRSSCRRSSLRRSSRDRQPTEDFTVAASPGAPVESGDGAGEDKFPWGAVARVVASAVPSIIAEFTKGKGSAPDLAVDPATGEQK